MTIRSAWIAATGQTREDTRLTVLGAMTPVNAVQARSGILPGSDEGTYRVTGFSMVKASAMAGSVHAGRALLQGPGIQGAYPVTLPEPLTVTFADGDPQFDRIDLVVLRVYDTVYDGSGRTEAAVEIIRGTPAASPVAPAVPPLALPLYQVRVRAGASAANGIDWTTGLTDLRTTTVGVGGILPAYGDSGVPGSYPGQYKDSNGQLQRWDGSAWVAYPSGIGGIAPTGALATASYVGQYRDGSGGVLQRWDGTAWRPTAPGPTVTCTADAGSTTSTTYTETVTDSVGFPVVVSFTAPASGKVLVSLGSSCAAHVAGASAWMSVNVRQGATVKLAAGDDNAARNFASTADDFRSVSTQFPVSGLAPGSACTATVAIRTSSAAASALFDNVYLRVEPLL